MSDHLPERFWAKVNFDGPIQPHMDTPCWEWTAYTRGGYGALRAPSANGKPGRTVIAHRYSAMLHFGMFDSRLQVLHRCDNPKCVRPDHLFLGDRYLNMQDMSAKKRSSSQRKTHCPNGHEYADENLLVHKDGKRRCRECRRAQSVAVRARRSGRG